jgi:hypothetical protein
VSGESNRGSRSQRPMQHMCDCIIIIMFHSGGTLKTAACMCHSKCARLWVHCVSVASGNMQRTASLLWSCSESTGSGNVSVPSRWISVTMHAFLDRRGVS